MELMSIGEFARRSRLSQKALRLYDELGLLPPARVDPDSGYRSYGAGQLEQLALSRPFAKSGSHSPRSGLCWVWSREPRPAMSPGAGPASSVNMRRVGIWPVM